MGLEPRPHIRPPGARHAIDSSALAGVRPLIEEFPLERTEAAYARMMRRKVRFRVVLQIA